MAAPAFRSDAEVTTATMTNITITKPTGTTTNDILIAQIYREVTTDAVTLPGGWALIAEIEPKADHQVTLAWLRAGGSEPANYTFSFANSYAGGLIACYSGCVTSGNPWSATPTQNSGTTGATLTFSSVTTVDADCLLIALGTAWEGGTQTPPSGFTETSDFPYAGYNSYNTQASAGASGDKTATMSGGSNSWTAVLIPLKPPGGGTVVQDMIGMGIIPFAR